MGQSTLETERLTLVPLRAEHTDAVVEVFADESMSTYLDLDISAPDNAREMMRKRLAFDGPPGMGHWAFLHHGLTDLALNSVWALVHVDNKPSLQLAARLGFLAVGTAVHYGAEHRVHVALPR
ncbi:GNAT family N-acetyltransferase [Nocardia suismassiliense]|uniref:GNAT family N-acetyltransferase n=1 Tax=Nocardia suismassiliense TaxID=2077092 RepID=A0ABW6R5L0_9NOCA